MALSVANGDPLAQNNGGQNPLTSANISDSQGPSTATFAGDHPALDGGRSGGACRLQQRLHAVPKTTGSNQSLNGSVVKQNGSLRNLASSCTAVSSPATVTDSQRPSKCHPSCTHSPPPPVLCCQHCHFRSTLACPCLCQSERPLLQTPSTGPRSGSVPHHGSTPACPCCLSACTYSHHHHQTHPSHSASPLCLHHHQHHHHHQRWQDHLQSQTPGIRYVGRLFHIICIWHIDSVQNRFPGALERSILVFQALKNPPSICLPPYCSIHIVVVDVSTTMRESTFTKGLSCSTGQTTLEGKKIEKNSAALSVSVYGWEPFKKN